MSRAGGDSGGHNVIGRRDGGVDTGGTTFEGAGFVRGTGYEPIGEPLTDSEQKERWSGRLPPCIVEPTHPGLCLYQSLHTRRSTEWCCPWQGDPVSCQLLRSINQLVDGERDLQVPRRGDQIADAKLDKGNAERRRGCDRHFWTCRSTTSQRARSRCDRRCTPGLRR